MQRRDVLRSVGAASAAGLAGCSVLGDDCGPGDDEIADVAAGLETSTDESDGEGTAEEGGSETEADVSVSLKGTVESTSQEEVIIDDTTGKAALMTLGGGFTTQNAENECAHATGIPIPPSEDRDDDVDVAIFVETVGLED